MERELGLEVRSQNGMFMLHVEVGCGSEMWK
jgi:hypothetical protein